MAIIKVEYNDKRLSQNKQNKKPEPIPQTPPSPPKMPFGIEGFKKKLCEDLCFEIKDETSSIEYYQKVFKSMQKYLDANKTEDDYEKKSNKIKIFAKKYVQNLMQKGNTNPKKELDILINEVRQNMQADFLNHVNQSSYDQPHDKSYMARRDANIMEIENAIEKSFQEQIKKSWFERIFKNGKER